MLFNCMIAAEISGMSRKVNALQTVSDKLPCGIMCKSNGAHQIEYLALGGLIMNNQNDRPWILFLRTPNYLYYLSNLFLLHYLTLISAYHNIYIRLFSSLETESYSTSYSYVVTAVQSYSSIVHVNKDQVIT